MGRYEKADPTRMTASFQGQISEQMCIWVRVSINLGAPADLCIYIYNISVFVRVHVCREREMFFLLSKMQRYNVM